MKHLPYVNTNLKNLKNEVWVDAFGFDGYYEVSNLGRIKSVSQREVRTGIGIMRILPIKVLKQTKAQTKRIRGHKFDDRLACGFYIDGKRYVINVARLVYQSFHPNENIDNKVISHINRCYYDNRLDNLVVLNAKEMDKRR
jgi:hypothetical protein